MQPRPRCVMWRRVASACTRARRTAPSTQDPLWLASFASCAPRGLAPRISPPPAPARPRSAPAHTHPTAPTNPSTSLPKPGVSVSPARCTCSTALASPRARDAAASPCAPVAVVRATSGRSEVRSADMVWVCWRSGGPMKATGAGSRAPRGTARSKEVMEGPPGLFPGLFLGMCLCCSTWSMRQSVPWRPCAVATVCRVQGERGGAQTVTRSVIQHRPPCAFSFRMGANHAIARGGNIGAALDDTTSTRSAAGRAHSIVDLAC